MISLWIAQASAAAQPPNADATGGWLVDPELVAPGYTQTMAGGTIQTAFPPPPPPPNTPEWLKTLGDAVRSLFDWLSPLGEPLLWIGGILLVLLLLYLFVPAFAQWVDDLRYRRKRQALADEADLAGHAEAGAARILLGEADELAAAGRYAEAVHLLLYRSVADISDRRPGLVQPAMTSRDLAAATDLPGVAREAFSRIARAVEISLFGGRAIDAGAWEQCRTAYAEMTVPRNWVRT
ncbi:hypothetical protein ASD67_00170 [Sphingopyxis sp. Root1497]|uniref:DUF4129 domain-containing protein n=1 Tax=Sphingopyxis sp. Root1497 TaxID=1736474 RepID=UPI0006F7EAD9|nr:DUF4129 domain-containing protein [Sphingopyxis sp. Root1497]KQZ65569.1 hypothetical protein ASD67_00170 [Sphingopyxis sp. Root1497]